MSERREATLCMTRSVLFTGMLHFTFYNKSDTVLDTIHYSSLASIGCLVYYIVFFLFRDLTPKHWGLHTHPTHASEYSDFERMGRPFLTVTSVFNVVYGLGFAFYVTSYSISSVSLMSTLILVLSLMILSYHEVLYPLRSTNNKFSVILCRFLVIFLMVLGVVLGMGFDKLGTYSTKNGTFIWDFVFPLCTFYLYFGVKSNDNVCLGGTWELCEFGLPIMSMQAIMFLLVERSVESSISKNSTLPDFTNKEAITLTLAPFPLVACFWNLLRALFKNSIVDVLVGVGTVTAFARLIDRGTDAYTVSSIMCVCSAMFIRLFTAATPLTEKLQINMLDTEIDDLTNENDVT